MRFEAKLGISMLLIALTSISGSYISSMKVADPFSHNTLSHSEKSQLAKRLKPALVQGIDSIASHFQERYGLNASVMVNYKGYKVFDKAYGTKQPGGKQALTESDPFQLASVSKQFTAMAVLMLVDDGKLSLSDTVKQHISYFPYEGITVEQVMRHTAGLPNYMWAVEHHWDKERAPYNDEVLQLMDSLDLNLYFRPGTRFFYANTGYITLAHLVEKVSGQRFDQFLERRIFDPLNMEHAFVYSKCWDKGYPDRLKGYRGYGYRKHLVKDNALDGSVGDKGVYATGADLYKWDQALYEGKLISDSLLTKAFQPTKLLNGYEINYGYGFRLAQHQGDPVVYHNGLWHGFRTTFKRYVKDSISLVVLNNTNSRVKGMLVDRLEAFLHEHKDTDPVYRMVFQTLEAKQDQKQSLKAFTRMELSAGQVDQLRKVVNYLRQMRMNDKAENLMRVYRRKREPVATKSDETAESIF